MLKINIKTQTLGHYRGEVLVKNYLISSAKNGTGEVFGSFCTPTGLLRICEKIGQGLVSGAILKGRVATGEVFSQQLRNLQPDADWILTRILWLAGADTHNQNTQKRYIYIHGCPDDVRLGVAGSCGCIRMRNDDIIELFDEVQIDEEVVIIER